MELFFRLVNGEKIEQSTDLEIITIGRSAKCDVVIPHEGMSRHHCQIEVKDGEVFITDLGSTNGVMIDGQKIEPHKKVRYLTYLSLAFGAVQSLQIELEGKRITHDHSQTDKTTQHRANFTRTTTKQMQEQLKTGQTQESFKVTHRKEDVDGRIKFWIKNALALLFLVGVAYVFFSMQDSDSPKPKKQDTSIPKDEEFDRF